MQITVPKGKYRHLENGGNKHLLNVSKCLPDYRMQHPRRQLSSQNKSIISITEAIIKHRKRCDM